MQTIQNSSINYAPFSLSVHLTSTLFINRGDAMEYYEATLQQNILCHNLSNLKKFLIKLNTNCYQKHLKIGTRFKERNW